MDVSPVVQASSAVPMYSSTEEIQAEQKSKESTDSQVNLATSASSGDAVSIAVDKVSIEMSAYKTLTVLANKVLTKLQEVLGASIPDFDIKKLKPEDHTPEKTADNIVSGVLGLFGVYQQQNPKLSGEELITKFLDTIKGGIKSGYEDAMGILDGAGAFEIDGVKSGIDKTMSLVEAKLNAFEDDYRKKNNLAPREGAVVEEKAAEEPVAAE